MLFDDTYKKYREQMLGTSCELFVNPNDPSDTYGKIPDSFKKGMTFIGICCLIGAGGIIYSFFFAS